MNMDLHFKNTIRQVGLAGMLCFSSITNGLADPAPDLSQLPEYLANLGAFLGYNISQPPTTTALSTLLGGGLVAENIEQTSLATLLGTFLNKTIVDPNSSSPQIPLNQLINTVFKTAPYSTPSTPSSGSVTVSASINQLPYQTNPVSQTILDLLTTPDFSFCKLVTNCSTGNTSTGSLTSKCCNTPHTYLAQIGINTLGTLPPPANIADPLDPNIIKQLNSNSLVGPLLLSTERPTSASSTSSSPNSSNSNLWSSMSTLTAVSQAQAAANFIRYASSAVAPPPQTDLSTYQTLYNLAMGLPTPPKATPTSSELAIAKSAQAQQSLATYLTNMRTIAAQTSVGVANLNELLTKRLPQNPSGSGAPTSQALNEYVMATRRLYDVTIPAPTGNNPSTQWVDQINAASSATVQKEIAILLSEINYQLYLSRQQQDRLILTNSIMLFQLSRLVTPPPLQPPNQ